MFEECSLNKEDIRSASASNSSLVQADSWLYIKVVACSRSFPVVESATIVFSNEGFAD